MDSQRMTDASQTSPSPRLALTDFWPYQVAVLADKVSRYTLSVARRHGDLNTSQWRVLAAVGDKPGCTSVDVVAMTPMDKGVVSRAVSSLIEESLIDKIPDLKDKRRATLELTGKGKHIYGLITHTLSQTPLFIHDDSDAANTFLKTIKSHIDNMPAPLPPLYDRDI